MFFIFSSIFVETRDEKEHYLLSVHSAGLSASVYDSEWAGLLFRRVWLPRSHSFKPKILLVDQKLVYLSFVRRLIADQLNVSDHKSKRKLY